MNEFQGRKHANNQISKSSSARDQKRLLKPQELHSSLYTCLYTCLHACPCACPCTRPNTMSAHMRMCMPANKSEHRYKLEYPYRMLVPVWPIVVQQRFATAPCGAGGRSHIVNGTYIVMTYVVMAYIVIVHSRTVTLFYSAVRCWQQIFWRTCT